MCVIYRVTYKLFLFSFFSCIAGGRNPLQNSHLTNQMSSHKEPVAPNKVCVLNFEVLI